MRSITPPWRRDARRALHPQTRTARIAAPICSMMWRSWNRPRSKMRQHGQSPKTTITLSAIDKTRRRLCQRQTQPIGPSETQAEPARGVQQVRPLCRPFCAYRWAECRRHRRDGQNVAEMGREIDKLSQISGPAQTDSSAWHLAPRRWASNGTKLADIFKDTSDKVGEFLATGGGPLRTFEVIAPKVGVTAQAFRDLSGPQALQLYFDSLQKAGVGKSR